MKSTSSLFSRPEGSLQEVVPRVDDLLMSDVLKGKVATLDEEGTRHAQEIASRLVMAEVQLTSPEVEGPIPILGSVRGMRSWRRRMSLELRTGVSDACAVIEVHVRVRSLFLASLAITQEGTTSAVVSSDAPMQVVSVELCDADLEQGACTLLVHVGPVRRGPGV